MMRLANFSVVGCFLVAILIMAMWPENSRFGGPERALGKVQDQLPQKSKAAVSQGSLQVEAAEKAMNVVLSFDLAEQSFSDVLEQLEKKTGLNFVLTSSAMDDSLSGKQPITFQINAMPLNKALALMLESHNAAYVINGGVVKIISLDDAMDPKWHRIKMFDCRKLLDSLPETSPVASTNAVSGGGAKVRGGTEDTGGGGNRAGGGMFAIQPMAPQLPALQSPSLVLRQDPARNDSKLLEQKLGQLVALVQAQAQAGAEKSQVKPSSEHTLLDLVTTMVSPDSWEQAMGAGKIRLVNGILIISQTESTLLEISSFLTDLKLNVLTSSEIK
ncbi:STN domain-containing protein [Mariniblastus sp.]|nr:STN domain-containing protein [Mariniblastus sp.]